MTPPKKVLYLSLLQVVYNKSEAVSLKFTF